MVSIQIVARIQMSCLFLMSVRRSAGDSDGDDEIRLLGRCATSFKPDARAVKAT